MQPSLTGELNSMSFFKKKFMKELNTKIGVFLTTYTKQEIDNRIEISLEENNSDDFILFMDKIRSFNPDSPHYITEKEAIELIGLEKKKGKNTPNDLYTNYKGSPLGIGVTGVQLFFTDPIKSLKSAFEMAAPKFDFKKDFFHIRLVN